MSILKRLGNRIKGNKKEHCYVNSSFICGEVIKSIQKDYWKEEFKSNKRLMELLEGDIVFIISSLTEFEIKKRLIRKYNKTFEESNKILEEFKSKFPKLITVDIKDIKITFNLLNWILKQDLGFRDGIHIIVAQRLDIPLITSERDKNLNKWKKAYEGVYSIENFWKVIKRK